jgi:hypothetical protein
MAAVAALALSLTGAHRLTAGAEGLASPAAASAQHTMLR